MFKELGSARLNFMQKLGWLSFVVELKFLFDFGACFNHTADECFILSLVLIDSVAEFLDFLLGF